MVVDALVPMIKDALKERIPRNQYNNNNHYNNNKQKKNKHQILTSIFENCKVNFHEESIDLNYTFDYF